MRHNPPPKTIGLLALPDVQLLDIAGPADVFAEANRQAGKTLYNTIIIGHSAAPLRSTSGMTILPDQNITTESNTVFDTLLIAGSPSLTHQSPTPATLDWVKKHAPQSRRFGSVCTGALVLAATGLIHHRRITTHWAVAEQLTQHYPTITVEADALFTRDGPVCTAAGVTAGLDLALALVHDDHGHDLARRVSAHLVMFFRRPGGQRQFSRHGTTHPIGRSMLQDIQRRVLQAPHEPADTAHLAALAGLSTRHFSRLFHAEAGLSPATWVEKIRIEAARSKLEEGLPPKTVAAAVGFHDVDTFRRAFQRQLSITPADYRHRHSAVP